MCGLLASNISSEVFKLQTKAISKGKAHRHRSITVVLAAIILDPCLSVGNPETMNGNRFSVPRFCTHIVAFHNHFIMLLTVYDDGYLL
jgi:hypothetical protein